MPNEENYKLISIANHLGAKIKCGHYQTLIKIGTKWMKCDDDKHFKTSLEKELNESNYIVVYEKIGSVSASPSPSIIEKLYEDQPSAPNLNKMNEKIPTVFSDDTEIEQEFQSIQPENHSMEDKFVCIQGDIRFEEVEQGNVQCGGCKKSFNRIIGHLSNNIKCAEKVNLPELKSEWQKSPKEEELQNMRATRNLKIKMGF